MSTIAQQTPVVSIVCITFMHEKYIRQTLDGFVMQKTDFPFEILVHDDASTDDTAAIIREYEAKHPQLFRCICQTENQYQKGISPTSILLRMARGEFIAICEGDDFWTNPDKLQMQVDILRAHPECYGCCHNTLVVDGDAVAIDGEMQTIHYENKDVIHDKTFLKKHCRFCRTPSLMLRSELFCKDDEWWQRYLGFKANGDMKMSALVAAHGSMYHIARTMASYRYVTSGTTSWNARNKGKNINLITYEALERIRTYIRSEYGAELDYSGYYLWLTINSLKRYIKNRTPENKAVWRSLLHTYSNPVIFLFKAVGYCFGKLFRKLFKR